MASDLNNILIWKTEKRLTAIHTNSCATFTYQELGPTLRHPSSEVGAGKRAIYRGSFFAGFRSALIAFK